MRLKLANKLRQRLAKLQDGCGNAITVLVTTHSKSVNMLRIILFIFTVGLSTIGTAHALGPECDQRKEGSTLAESCTLQEEFRILDVELNATYKQLLLQRKSPDFKSAYATLKESQRLWVAYRDKTCAFEQAEYGGIVSISFSRCLARLTRERVTYLKELL